MEHHDQLQKHCRIWGNKLSKSRPQPVHSCAEYISDLCTFVELGFEGSVEYMI